MSRVSRETDVPPGDVVKALFPQRSKEISLYVDLLISRGIDRGLIGPREVPRIWERHVLNCAVVAPAIEPDARVADVGSGAGLPGLVWAIARADLQLTLIESLRRRTDFLSEVVDELGLGNVTVARDRAEDFARNLASVGPGFDIVTARAVAPLERLIGWTAPLCRPGGEILAFKGATAEAEVRDAKRALAKYRITAVGIESYGAGMLDLPVSIVRLKSA